jgi:tellurite resistance protein TerC
MTIWLWIGFLVLILLLLALDLGVLNRRDHEISAREAMGWTSFWVALALLFNAAVYHIYEQHWLGIGTSPGYEQTGWKALIHYFEGWLVEKSLSLDNIFVIAMIFRFFAVPPLYQHRVLFWGILGALLMRGVMIGVGAKLIAEFHWILYVFAAFLILTAIKMLFFNVEHSDPNQNAAIRLTRRLFPVTARFHGQHFTVRAGSAASHESEVPGAPPMPDPVVEKVRPGTRLLTPLALALVMVETTDLIFAVDSIPAIFAITSDPFLVFTSNVFAILGLRSLYFALAGMVEKFRYLKTSLALVLLLVGVKMLLAGWLKNVLGRHFNLVLLLVVLAILGAGVATSLWADRRAARAPAGG